VCTCEHSPDAGPVAERRAVREMLGRTMVEEKKKQPKPPPQPLPPPQPETQPQPHPGMRPQLQRPGET